MIINNIHIEGFKCFEKLSIPASLLNLYTGLNAAGKSTAMQSILLLSQSLQANHDAKEIILNGPLVQLGSSSEVINSEKGIVQFQFSTADHILQWSMFISNGSKKMSITTDKIVYSNLKNDTEITSTGKNFLLSKLVQKDETLRLLIQKIKNTVFLSALRSSENETFPIPNTPSSDNADVGVLGQYSPWFYYNFMDDEIDSERLNPQSESNLLWKQMNAWVNEFFPGARVGAQLINNTNLVRLEFKMGATSAWCRPANIGYGLTYIFPILVAGLLAKKGQILIIDSPEAHLHPSGQSLMGCFLAKIAKSGVQIFVETHSDHVLNGVRKAIIDKVIDPEDTSIIFFAGQSGDGENNVKTPQIDNKGNLDEWPEGFFDQMERDTVKLIGW